MGGQMDTFREKLDVEAARDAVPEMSPYEEPYYRSGPIILSMFPRYPSDCVCARSPPPIRDWLRST